VRTELLKVVPSVYWTVEQMVHPKVGLRGQQMAAQMEARTVDLSASQ
jgi:hypothetical protein